MFGYDPLKYVIGRGALEATGIGFELQDGDVAIRCNFCTLDEDGNITDRRAGRIPTEEMNRDAFAREVASQGGSNSTASAKDQNRFIHGRLNRLMIFSVHPGPPITGSCDPKREAECPRIRGHYPS